MITRSQVVAGLLAIEIAVVGAAVVAIRGSDPASSSTETVHVPVPRIASGSHLVEGGPARTFDAGDHPALSVDVGYADLTILPNKAPQIDVSVSASSAFGMLRATDPIGASEDAGTIRIATNGQGGWSAGDDRMVTVLVPPETKVTVVSAGDIKASGLRAEASLNSVGRGSVTVEDFDAPALHVAANERILLQQVVAPRLDVTSDDGHVIGSELQVRDGSVESDGRVTLGFAAGSDTLVTAEASDGKIGVTGFAGVPTLPTVRKSDGDDNDSSSQTVRVGAGEGHLDVHSSDGNITLAQEN
jgi:hypothetical protein